MGGRGVGSQGLEETPRTLLTRPSESTLDRLSRRYHQDFPGGENDPAVVRACDAQSSGPHSRCEAEIDFSCLVICHILSSPAYLLRGSPKKSCCLRSQPNFGGRLLQKNQQCSLTTGTCHPVSDNGHERPVPVLTNFRCRFPMRPHAGVAREYGCRDKQ